MTITKKKLWVVFMIFNDQVQGRVQASIQCFGYKLWNDEGFF